jgi:hypothetical protein
LQCTDVRRFRNSPTESSRRFLHTFLSDHNRRFARVAAKPEDYHGRKPTGRELRQIFRLESERTISNDWVIRHEGRSLQLQPGRRRYGPTNSKALVCEWEDGATEVYYRGERIAFIELQQPPRKICPPLRPSVQPVLMRKPKQKPSLAAGLAKHEGLDS